MYVQDVAQLVFNVFSAAGNLTLIAPQAKFWNVLLDATALGVANLSVSIQIFSPQGSLYLTPTQIGSPQVANPISVAFGTVPPLIYIPGPISQVRVSIPAFGTSTGNINAAIWAI